MLTQLYGFQFATGWYTASLKTGHLPKWTYLKENRITCVMGPCHADGLPANAAIANFDPHASTARGRQFPNPKSHQSSCKQTGRTDKRGSGSCIPSARVAYGKDALLFSDRAAGPLADANPSTPLQRAWRRAARRQLRTSVRLRPLQWASFWEQRDLASNEQMARHRWEKSCLLLYTSLYMIKGAY